jgi:hypothetical protein
MKNLKISLIIFLFNFGCTRDPKEVSFTIEKGQIHYIDSVKIQEDGYAFNFVFNEKIYQDSLLLFGDGSFSAIHLFNTKSGKRIGLFNSETVEEYPIPERSYTNAYISQDSIFLLNHFLNKIFVFSIYGDFLFEKKLNFSKPNYVLDYETFFDRIEDKLFISTRFDGPISQAFNESTVLSMFSYRDGAFLKTFGNFPSTYSKGALALSQSENVISKNGYIYVLNVAGVPILKKYNIDGELLEFFELKSEIHEPVISYFNEDPSESKLMDQFLSLATDKSKDDNIFYAAYTHFNDRNKASGGDTFSYVLMKIDLNSKTIMEKEILGPWHYFELRSLLREVKGDTLSLLVRGMDENLYLKRFLFD